MSGNGRATNVCVLSAWLQHVSDVQCIWIENKLWFGFYALLCCSVACWIVVPSSSSSSSGKQFSSTKTEGKERSESGRTYTIRSKWFLCEGFIFHFFQIFKKRIFSRDLVSKYWIPIQALVISSDMNLTDILTILRVLLVL